MRASVIVVSAVVMAISASAVAAAGQTSGSAARRRSAKSFVPPRTPWGDPDISGNVTNVFEASTPFERPDDFAGRRLEEVQGEELATFRGDLRKGGQAWFVIDPPDGKIPRSIGGTGRHPVRDDS